MSNDSKSLVERADEYIAKHIRWLSLKQTDAVSIIRDMRTHILHQQSLISEAVWLPIETAPNYEAILVTNGIDVYEAQYDGEECKDPFYNEWEEGVRGAKITHWQPLPTPPSLAKLNNNKEM